MAKAKATVQGAISLVNAIANKKGATLGIDLKVVAEIETIQVRESQSNQKTRA